jgi:hypothetical protein
MPDLELQLRALAEEAVWPATPDIAAAVARAPRERRTGARARVRAALAPRGHRARRVVAAGLALLLLVPAAAVAFPGARNDVLEWLGIRDVEIRRVPSPPPGTRPELEPDLGRVVPLAQAEREAGFAAAIPAALGEPDRVRILGQRISLVYAPREGLPRLDEVDAGLILTQSRGAIHGVYLEKLLLGGATAERVKVRGRLGAFISGDHAYLYETDDGQVREDRPLLAGPTLIWTGRGRVYRLEAAAPREKVLQIAHSVRP